MRLVAHPITGAVVIVSLFASVVKIASNPCSSASRAAVRTSGARQPTPVITAIPTRCGSIPDPSRGTGGEAPLQAFRSPAAARVGTAATTHNDRTPHYHRAGNPLFGTVDAD